MRASAARAAQAARARAAGDRRSGGARTTGGRSGRKRAGGTSPKGAPAAKGTSRVTARPGRAFGEQRSAGDGAASAGPAIAGMDAVRRPVGYTPRRSGGLTGFERVLLRAGLGPVAGIDEAGRGACAGPLVVAAVAIDRWDSASMPGIADSKALTARAREAAYRTITRSALAWNVVIISPAEIDRLGLHVCNVAGMRRALAGLQASPGYVLTDGFEVPGLAVPALAMWKGDQVAACVAAASIVAKVTRDRIMTAMSGQYPQYGFARHKGYSTPSHMAALDECGPCPAHRRSFVNVSARMDSAVRPRTAVPAEDLEPGVGIVLADGSVLALDEEPDGPIVELIADSPAVAGGDASGECGPDQAGPAASASASAEGRT